LSFFQKEYNKNMANQIVTKKEKSMEALLKELREINKNLKKFLLMIPEESLKEYKNISQIKKAFAKATKLYPPK
jgi:vacuolar-type H+-ATPase subunit F/Vma7